MIGIGVTGSDTGVGKTVVACAIARALSNRRARVSVLKPVETGVDPQADGSDAGRLAAAARAEAGLVVRPYVFRDPVAPIVAARAEGRPIELTRLDEAFAQLGANSDAVVVEGAGGLLVPIAPAVDFGVLFSRWGLDAILVVPDRLGSINQALMSLRAAAHAKLAVLAVVLSDVRGDSAGSRSLENARTIAEFGSGVPVVEFPWIPDTLDFDASASAAERCGLMDVILQRARALA